MTALCYNVKRLDMPVRSLCDCKLVFTLHSINLLIPVLFLLCREGESHGKKASSSPTRYHCCIEAEASLLWHVCIIVRNKDTMSALSLCAYYMDCFWIPDLSSLLIAAFKHE